MSFWFLKCKSLQTWNGPLQVQTSSLWRSWSTKNLVVQVDAMTGTPSQSVSGSSNDWLEAPGGTVQTVEKREGFWIERNEGRCVNECPPWFQCWWIFLSFCWWVFTDCTMVNHDQSAIWMTRCFSRFPNMMRIPDFLQRCEQGGWFVSSSFLGVSMRDRIAWMIVVRIVELLG